MEKMKITDYHYYPDSDELDLVINVDQPRAAISVPLEDEFFFLRVDPETDEIVGATIMNASHYLGQLAHAFAVKAFDDPNVRFFLERRVEAFALETA
jgi:hypothetical protein